MLLELILVIIVVGLVMWVINFIPMPRAIKSLLNLLVVILLIIYILQAFGLISPIIAFPKFFT